MDTGIFVQPGDPWKPESAARYNQVNDMLNSLTTIGPVSNAFSSSPNDSILCKNISDEVIPAYSYVTISGAKIDGEYWMPELFSMKRGIADPCGVVLSDCSPGETASVQICGLVPAEVTPSPSDVMTFPGTLSGYDRKNLVNLNSFGGSVYRNYFKVEPTRYTPEGTISQVRIYDGGDPDNVFCGETDVGGVSRHTLDHNFIDGCKIYIRLCQGDDGRLFHEFETDIIEKGKDPVICLAEISRNNRVIQRWTGGKIYWRERFIIPFSRGDV